MTNRGFYSLIFILVFEVLIGYGMLFGLSAESSTSSRMDLPKFAEVDFGEQSAKTYQYAAYPMVSANPPEDAFFPSLADSANQGEPITIRNLRVQPQGQLADAPEIVRAVYLTSWSAGSQRMIDYVISLSETVGVNAVVMDIKDFSGEVSYDIVVPEVEQYGAKNVKIRNLDATLKKLHEKDIYAIARVTVFQDPVLAVARPDLAVQSVENKTVWKDDIGLAWIDPGAKEAWNYTVAIARDAASRGFDEINFDYIRFPSDGDLQDMEFPFAEEGATRREVLKEFFAYVDEHVHDIAISADLFGLTTSSRDDLGIGQVIEDAYWHFDYVYPMVYPSHYAYRYHGYARPAEYPYEVVKSSMERARARLRALQAAHADEEFAKLRPWLQDFDLGADYDALMVQAQIQATKEAMGEDYAGFLLWAPTNIYTEGALGEFEFNKAVYDAKPRTGQEKPKETAEENR